MASAVRTTDHQTIQDWVQARGGHPAHVAGTGRSAGDPGILRIDFPGYSGEGRLEPLDWDSWFDAFEAHQLAFLHQEDSDSRFSKLVRRRPADDPYGSPRHERGKRRPGRSSKVDINTANEEELQALWGVGPATARRIVTFRDHAGRIRSPKDLHRIEGLDGPTIENLARQVEFA